MPLSSAALTAAPVRARGAGHRVPTRQAAAIAGYSRALEQVIGGHDFAGGPLTFPSSALKRAGAEPRLVAYLSKYDVMPPVLRERSLMLLPHGHREYSVTAADPSGLFVRPLAGGKVVRYGAPAPDRWQMTSVTEPKVMSYLLRHGVYAHMLAEPRIGAECAQALVGKAGVPHRPTLMLDGHAVALSLASVEVDDGRTFDHNVLLVEGKTHKQAKVLPGTNGTVHQEFNAIQPFRAMHLARTQLSDADSFIQLHVAVHSRYAATVSVLGFTDPADPRSVAILDTVTYLWDETLAAGSFVTDVLHASMLPQADRLAGLASTLEVLAALEQAATAATDDPGWGAWTGAAITQVVAAADLHPRAAGYHLGALRSLNLAVPTRLGWRLTVRARAALAAGQDARTVVGAAAEGFGPLLDGRGELGVSGYRLRVGSLADSTQRRRAQTSTAWLEQLTGPAQR